MLSAKAFTGLSLAALICGAAMTIGCEGTPNATPNAAQSNPQEIDDNGDGAIDGEDEGELAYREAEVGVGKKGKSLEDEKGVGKMIVQPAVALFRFRQKAVFEIQIPHAMALYKASHGNFPKTQEEFDTKIIQANNIQLPELEEGQRYVYDPQTSKLMVEYRKK
jgi:hypothetical protein